MTKTPYLVQTFDKALHDRRAFSCGIEELDRWIREGASGMVRDGKASVHCLLDRMEWDAAQTQNRKARIIGYYGICAHSIEPDAAADLGKRYTHPIPAAYITTIAVDQTAQGKQLGTFLMIDAIERCVTLSESLGLAAIVLDVREDQNYDRRLKFYRDLGFDFLNPAQDTKRLALTIKDARASL